MSKYLKIAIIIIFICTALISACTPALAEIVPEAGKEAGNYTLDDFVVLAVNVAKWILGIVGSLALLFFIYGGFVFIFSGGNIETVSKGKMILINSIIGLVIVFASYLIIQFALSALGVEGGEGFWARPGWFKE